MAFINGRLPSTSLATCYRNPIQHLRKGNAANSFARLSQRSHAKGYGFIVVTDGYRSLAAQERIFLARYRKQSVGVGPFGDVRWWKGERYVRVSGTGTVAVPGTSNHGLGLAVDLAEPYMTTGPKHAWLVSRLAFYGWYWEGQAFGEPWHYTFKGFPARPTLEVGVKGDAVVAWQCILRYDLGVNVAMDGVFGSKTRAYTKTWQSKRGLDNDGIVGLRSWKAAGLA